MTRIIILGVSAAVAAGLLFVNFYNSVIDAASWSANFPDSVAVAREYYKVVNPGNFFRIASPLSQVCALLSLVVTWKFRAVKYLALAALLFSVSADVLTFSYFYPRLELMFNGPLNESTRLAVEQWMWMNWPRTLICVANTVCAFSALILFTKTLSK